MVTESLGTRARERGRPALGRFFAHRATELEGASQRKARAPSRTKTQRLANGLGYFSIGLGAAQLIVPAAVARAAGVPFSSALMRLCGAREFMSGVMILNRPARRAPYLWMRVAGDVLDLAVVGAAIASPRNRRYRDNALFASAAVAGVTLLDIVCATRLTEIEQNRRTPLNQEPGLEAGMVVNKTPEECYRAWHDFEKFPQFMQAIQSVQVLDAKRSHWTARAPGGATFEWDSEIVSDVPNSLIAWHALEGANPPNSGWVRFEPAPGDRGTIVRLHMQLDTDGNIVKSFANRLARRLPKFVVREDLRRFKQLIEAGEIPTTRGQPTGSRRRASHEG